MMIGRINADDKIINQEPSDERRRGLPREYFVSRTSDFRAVFPGDGSLGRL
jgi:hypothetical protein